MDRLQGYNINGYDYRRAAIERNNSERRKWMLREARDNVSKREEEERKNSKLKNNNDNNISELKTNVQEFTDGIKNLNNNNLINRQDKMFKPNEINNFKGGSFKN